MAHHHQHEHNHHHTVTTVTKAFYIGIALNMLFVVIEAVAGLWSGSLALLTDAGHNLGDVAGLALSLFALKITKIKAGPHYTYGYQKTTILVALLNSVILLIAIGGIGYEAILRIAHPQLLPGNTIAIVAAIGIVINGITAFLFFREKGNELNVRGAYIHLAADALVSVGVVIAGLLITFTGWVWVDSAISFIIIAVILYTTWKLLTDSIRLSLDGVPHNIDPDEVKSATLETEGVINVHHIHIWAIGTTESACTMHIVINKNASFGAIAKIKAQLKHKLEHLKIAHATIETEIEGENCHSEEC